MTHETSSGEHPEQPQQPASGQGYGYPPPPPPAGGQSPPTYQGQQPYLGQPAHQGQQPYPGQQQPATSGGGLDPKVGGLLAYLFTWLSGLVVYLTQRDRELRFHGAQAILLGIAWVVAVFAWTVMSVVVGFASDTLGSLFGFVGWLLGLAFVAVWVLMMVKAYNQEHYKLPVIGDLAETWASK
ncbi:DUF4870 domain-containing protein [Ornithinimicrobium sediminis]|uniref:DUF4870 domain-containing protein n=1 Tax=Ornithinimicrobium sediminis TaxID=2904603 RepID=UPI001E3F93F8|nr:DUF4870 domain-containing protein [Ornithinimicrobium sediminis]MCE0487943.1 DUF4870 domain-containing protein [Ornithinimicrobium sediminis]